MNPNYPRLQNPTDMVTSSSVYSKTPTRLYDVGYDVTIKGGGSETLYFASKKCHSQATEAVMKERPGSVVLAVKLRK